MRCSPKQFRLQSVGQFRSAIPQCNSARQFRLRSAGHNGRQGNAMVNYKNALFFS
jgi:hypothetical protein